MPPASDGVRQAGERLQPRRPGRGGPGGGGPGAAAARAEIQLPAPHLAWQRRAYRQSSAGLAERKEGDPW